MPANAQITINSAGLTDTQDGCVTEIGGNCALSETNQGAYSTATGATSASLSPSPGTASASFPPGLNCTSNSVYSSETGTFSIPTGTTGGTIRASGTLTAESTQVCSGTITTDANADSQFAVSFTLTAPTYYQLSFSMPVGTLGNYACCAQASNELIMSWVDGPSNVSNYTLSGILPAGGYYVYAFADTNANTEGVGNVNVSGQTLGGSVPFTFTLILSQNPISIGATDGPIPLWAFGVLGAGLIGIASRRLKRVA
jgi:hypothetical protein